MIENNPFWKRYKNIFSLEEFSHNNTLYFVVLSLLVTATFTFNRWLQEDVFSRDKLFLDIPGDGYICWPHWKECGEYYMNFMPVSYTGGIVFIIVLCLIFFCIQALIEKKIIRVHMALFGIFLVKFFGVFFLTYKEAGNYDYYDILFTFIVLFLPYKILFLRLTFIILYFVASPLKFDEGWILGQYFTTLSLGLPIFPDSLAPLITNAVIGLQLIGSWFLLSSRKFLQATAYILFGLFHVYSGTIVEYRYLLTTIPILYLLFGNYNSISPFELPKNIKALPGLVFLLGIIISQIWVTFGFSQDRKLTLEGNRYSIYMFEANHQCRSQINVVKDKGLSKTYDTTSVNARARCDLYKDWFFIRHQCDTIDKLQKVSWQYDHSVNGGPFYRIVDTKDACSLDYKPFVHNEWIRDERKEEYIVGYPGKNQY